MHEQNVDSHHPQANENVYFSMISCLYFTYILMGEYLTGERLEKLGKFRFRIEIVDLE